MRDFDSGQIAERSLMKTFKGPIFAKLVKAVDDYRLIEDDDRIAVAVSGGKDSLLLAKLLETYRKYGSRRFELQYLTLDPGYPDELLARHRENCEKLNIPINIFPANLFAAATSMAPESPCYLCARMRRGFLYSKAKELGCNKLALGHHFDDVIETTLLNIFYAGCFKTMLPKAKAENFDGMELIRPMYLIKEKDTIRFARHHQLHVIDCGCPVAASQLDSKRREIKNLIDSLRKTYKNIDINIFRAAENVNLASVLGYRDDTGRHSFLDGY